MAGPATENWWSSFLDAHGRDSEEETAFDGFLYTNGIPATAGPDELQTAYGQFVQWMQESEQREADRGPDRGELAKQQAIAELETQFVPKSRVSTVGVEKPLVAATRPPVSREPLAGGRVGPGGEAQLTPASGAEQPQHPQVHDQSTSNQPPPPESAQPGTASSPSQQAPGEPRHGQAPHEAESREGRSGRRGSGGSD